MSRYVLLLLRIVLIPVSLCYGLLTEIRNILYDMGLLPAYKSKIPVVSVGNISVGGTGKTPFTIWLAQHLGQRFKRIAIVSRGYKRRGRGLKIVAEQGKILCDVQTAGDEPMLMAHKVKDAFILVSENRKKALRHIELTEAADLIILDDAFQHRRVARDADVVLWRPGTFWDYWPLPTGRLREVVWRLKRATYLLQRKGNAVDLATRLIPAQRRFTVDFELGDVVDDSFGLQNKIEAWAGKRVVAFAGIAHPSSFFEMLAQKGIVLAETVAFADHYRYTEDDLSHLLHLCRKTGAQCLLCTEKDLVKIQEFLPVMEAELKVNGIFFGAVTLQVRLQREKEFMNDLIKRLTK